MVAVVGLVVETPLTTVLPMISVKKSPVEVPG